MPRGKPALKELIDAHFHRAGLIPADLGVTLRDRTPGLGRTMLSGTDIAAVRGGFIDLADGSRVPLHRVVEVRSRGAVIWSR